MGAGLLDVAAALRGTVIAYPVSINFGSGGATFDLTRELTVTNVGTSGGSFRLSVLPANPNAFPSVTPDSFELEPGASRTVSLTWSSSALDPGPYQGFIRVSGTGPGAEASVPYWYAVFEAVPKYLTVLSSPASGSTDETVSILFRLTDRSGVPVLSADPKVTSVSGGGSVLSVLLADEDYPGVFRARVRLSTVPGTNLFRIEAGELRREVTVRSGGVPGN